MKKISLLLVLLLAIGLNPVRASHLAGVTITYDCVSANVFNVTLSVYWDCSGATGFTNIVQIDGVGTSCTAPTAIGPPTLASVIEFTPIAPGTQTACQGNASVNGVEEHKYVRQYDFTGTNCPEYNLSWGTCCRNGIITSGQANQGIGVTSGTIRPGQSVCNNSPEWRTFPIYLAPQMSGTYDAGAYDVDGDSLVYSMITCTTDNFTPTTYAPGYTPLQPLGSSWNVTLNTSTGFLTFVPQPGNVVVGVICLKVEEYRNGVKIGEVTRDCNVTVSATGCTPSAAPAYTGITNLNNALYHNGSADADTLYVQPGTSFCFDVTTNDPDVGINQTLSWDRSILGATFSDPGNTQYDDIIDEDPTGRFCWTAPATPGSVDFILMLRDSSCYPQLADLHFITIMVGDTGTVWPGDANDDLIANNLDLLALGLAYGSTGPARSSASNTWIGQAALPWLDTISGGIDKKHQDCNGDGSVDSDDTLAISLNYGLTHTKARIPALRGQATDPVLKLIIPQDSASVGDTIEAIIVLGDSSVPASNVYGIAFTINYDATLIDSNTFSINFNPSWMGNASNSLDISHNNYTAAACDGAQVRIDHQNVSGMGQIATAHFIIIDNIDGKQQLLTTKMLNFFFSDIVLIGENGDRLSVDPQADSMLVYELSTEFDHGLQSGQDIQVYPNPANNSLTLQSNGSPIQDLEIWNLQGQLILKKEGTGSDRIRVVTDQILPGVYFIKVRNGSGSHTKRIHIAR